MPPKPKYKKTFKPFRPPAKPEAVGDILSAWLEKTGLMRRGAEEQIRAAWVEVVGPQIADLARPAGFRGGHLRITVAGAALRQELEGFRAAEIRAALNARLSGVTVSKISFKVGPVRSV